MVSGESRAQEPAPSPSVGRGAGVECPPLPCLSQQRAHTAAFAFLLNGSFRIRSKTEGGKKKNPTHFSELLSQFPFIPVMLVKCASLPVRPETAFQPHFLRADAGGALLPQRGTQSYARPAQLSPRPPISAGAPAAVRSRPGKEAAAAGPCGQPALRASSGGGG